MFFFSRQSCTPMSITYDLNLAKEGISRFKSRVDFIPCPRAKFLESCSSTTTGHGEWLKIKQKLKKTESNFVHVDPKEPKIFFSMQVFITANLWPRRHLWVRRAPVCEWTELKREGEYVLSRLMWTDAMWRDSHQRGLLIGSQKMKEDEAASQFFTKFTEEGKM